MKYIARAYVGLAWTDKLGEFNSQEDAIKSLEREYERQINEEGLTDFDKDWILNAFWENSYIEKVDDVYYPRQLYN